MQELRQLADDIQSELLYIMSKTQKSINASLSVVELTVAIHHVFHSPVDKILWDMEDQEALMHKARTPDNLSSYTCRGVFDPFGAGHGCSSISSGLGMAVARDIKGKRDRIVAVISNETTMAGQVYEAMSNAGYLDSNMVVILNDSHHSLHPKLEQVPKASINALSSTLSKLQSSKIFRKFREFAKVLTKKIGGGMHEWAAKIDEYARGMMGPTGSTLFEELGLYYIGPVDGHNIEDLVCVLREVASLNSMGPVLVHVITKEDYKVEDNQMSKTSDEHHEGSINLESLHCNSKPQTYSDHFVEALIRESEKDEDIVVVHAGMGMEPSFQLLKDSLQDKFFHVGMAEQHAVTFSAVHDVDRQKIPVRFVITSAGLVGSDGATHSGAFDITFMSCLPNMIVMAPSDETELARMVKTAVHIDDRPVCFRYPRGAVATTDPKSYVGEPIELGKGRVLVEGKDIALLGFGSMPLDIKLVRMLCKNHKFLITVEEGSIGGFGAHWRPITLPDNYIEGALPQDQLALAGLTGNHIAATALNLLGRTRDALLLMC
ncbi:hypothetical protein DH2020_046736 [Rehmannia glutinosa]|uniref:1-deoxy-D-xylulose-5-phosphate synthase n=1 Tax=Rehmannia glutinosa TaxID=99300 RepID=A0ABR0UAE7_REHGL